MKEWFKFKNCYINIDREKISFTSTGNWQETENLEEYTSKTKGKNLNALFSVMFILFVDITAMINVQNFEYSYNYFETLFDSPKFLILMTINVLLLVYYFLPKKVKQNIFSKNLIGKQVFLNSILKIEIKKSDVNIITKDEEIYLKDVSKKGIEIFRKLI
ncbi:hypothetical protein [Aureivirga marina]|uniref:hypothetical protein n=1 Tax=Aureivirga marina TaxID=1182451 RepID=UPI0018C8D75E|nr:hypothetical protein [Aureivirga marina]